MSSRLTDDLRTKDLAARFDLIVPRGFRATVTDWSFVKDEVAGDHIVVREIDMYDTDGKFVKTADLSMLQSNMHQFTILFQQNGAKKVQE